ncbi:hypothetical protein LTR10_020482 [Elasticomyces elasticus]|uniref:FAD dependent oxidoreductase domain-containing protein n=1 Tax=Exophiala sideris TaxID=1016849 RepID=A0ABR0J2F9_9EURO|nr:hypothetical protein LTR10_020482 [Elasticomyces elasticus]KAK5024718.1 hypothetical protein LTS07_008564 [Exophiala sideris]KAK5030811.1 hypothetical protein LTR13_008165 [Exophiala sideris]KAK5054353.1 hypothetical protein LTR69_008968 [Exophiala sideris]KAK5179753.1 hypothetical protein LTR44_007921 [Eurotiomycetes sp. CCFEE 6388]
MGKDQVIIIVGGGTFGLSSALHLGRRGYTNVKVFDPYTIPSPLSAGNDVNKIVDGGNLTTSTDEGYVGTKLFAKTIKGWREDPVFSPFYHETGLIFAASTVEGESNLIARYQPTSAMTKVETAQGFRALMHEGALTGDFPGWRGWYKPGRAGSGYTEARRAMESAFREVKRLNVQFVTGPGAGEVVGLLYESDEVRGVRTKDGLAHKADCVILAAGARSSELFEFEQQLLPKCWTLAHIKLEPQERALYRGNPIMSNIERGFFMVDVESGELKICNEFPGYTNFSVNPATGRKESKVLHRHEIPKEAEERIRSYLSECMPHLAQRPFSFARVCWCADTPDRGFLIGRHPVHKRLLFATGDSGRGFMHITSIGHFVVEALEGTLDPVIAKTWRWRPETAVERDFAHPQKRMGGIRRPEDLGDVKGWTKGNKSSRL